jgi:hypothetical protein
MIMSGVAAMARVQVAVLALVLLGCSDGQGEDLNGDGVIDRLKWSGDRCPPYSASPYPKNGYCYPD